MTRARRLRPSSSSRPFLSSSSFDDAEFKYRRKYSPFDFGSCSIRHLSFPAPLLEDNSTLAAFSLRCPSDKGAVLKGKQMVQGNKGSYLPLDRPSLFPLPTRFRRPLKRARIFWSSYFVSSSLTRNSSAGSAEELVLLSENEILLAFWRHTYFSSTWKYLAGI